ncbi:MAG: phage shock protein operon transcriptional activator [Wenzhouxiangella sp.]
MAREEQPIIGESPVFLTVLESVSRVADINRPVLIVGERGTGKELIAERLHYLSSRWDGPLVKLNCAAISENLLESDLFGHEAGAFTDAQGLRRGRFEQADGGTLFLDELATTSPAVQEKLLRLIEYGQFERLGGQKTISVDVRLVAATNDDLPSLVRQGRFRADLLDRLAFDVITLPPLRQRLEDILPLSEHFAMRMSAELGRPLFAGFDRRAAEQLLRYPWPGNIRELRNVVERAVYRHQAIDKPLDALVFDPFDSPWRQNSPAAEPMLSSQDALPDDLRGFLDQTEKELVCRALAGSDGNQQQAADRLGLSYDQLRGILRKHGLTGKQRSSGR